MTKPYIPSEPNWPVGPVDANGDDPDEFKVRLALNKEKSKSCSKVAVMFVYTLKAEMKVFGFEYATSLRPYRSVGAFALSIHSYIHKLKDLLAYIHTYIHT